MDLWGAPRCDRWRRSPLTKLTIAIAHRLPTLRNADCIYVMEQGQLVEGGSHEELLERGEPYASFW
jgi:ATP-binding cassette subfamily B protein